MAWNMTTLDTQTWPRGEVPGFVLTDEDVSLLGGVDCDILAPGDGDILAQGLIELIKYSYQQGVSFFGSLSRKNLQVKRDWLGAIWDG
jgi:hypothetical protein